MSAHRPMRLVLLRALAVLQLAFGIAMAIGGVRLLGLGGSCYYAIAGVAYCIAACLLWRDKFAGLGWTLGTFTFTVAWSLFEVGATFWPSIPRLVAPAILAMLGLLLSSYARYGLLARSGAAAVFLALLATLFGAFVPHGATTPRDAARRDPASMPSVSDWTHYGHDAAGSRFAPFDQVRPENVDQLDVAWTYRTGDVGPGEDQNVPLQIGDAVYTCSRNDHIAALDADTGSVRWTFDPRATSPFWQRCRGLGYYESDVPGHCRRRLVHTSIDARLMEIDADDGTLCTDFGKDGVVDLKNGLGPVKPGFYIPTSAPLVARGRIVVGAFVADNQERGEPSGVVRAFDAKTGELAWAWDLGNPAITAEPAPGETYTRGTPNMWSTASYDDALGLVYLPLGNATPDYYGVDRPPHSEEFSSSIVALGIDDGRVHWHVQTVHHDLWDYDVPSQPALIDLPGANGKTVPALLQATKRGQLFLLNRATGEALAEIAEKPVTQRGGAEPLAKTQPYSVGMPSIGAERLSEARMWGVTPLDQLWCRIQFRRLNYDGDFTPPGTQGSIQYPGNFGGMNWGSVSIDPVNGYAYMNDNRLPILVKLMSPQDARRLIDAIGPNPSAHGPALQAGTPYGVSVSPMMSPLGIPCNDPPFGTITAVDLRKRQIAWQVPVGTVEDTGPLGIVTHLPMPVGMPTIGGTMTTASGLVFFAGSQDFYLRAFDAANGRELWKKRMPVGSGSTPMSYLSPKTGRQYILISSGGTRQSPERGDYVIAYALPKTVSK